MVVFDVDNTLAPTGKGLGHELNCWISRKAGVSYEEVALHCPRLLARHGHVFWPLRDHFGLRDEDEPELWSSVTEAFHDNIDRHISPDPVVQGLMNRLASRTAMMVAFTANYRPHGERVLSAVGLDKVIPSHRTFGRGCVDEESKVGVEAYLILRERYLNDIPAETALIMVEDMANNLTGARAAGLYTVHIGPNRVSHRHAYAVDYRFPNILAVLEEMNGGRS